MDRLPTGAEALQPTANDAPGINTSDPLSIDQIIDQALTLCQKLGDQYVSSSNRIRELRDRLTHGTINLAVLGQFNRGKSTFLNALMGANLLPTSVLPLTNVPTRIRHGASLSCAISFTDGKPDAVAGPDEPAVRDLLSRFVTEERNANNKYCVKEAVISSPADLLKDGIVLIDTPGFGSTYQHNTRTTLDLLHECDAAFFLLSADLPITQVEIDFLKEVRKFMPRLFFVFNKVDLLSAQEQIRTDLFIKRAIVQHFGYSADLVLMPICAKQGLQALSHDPADEIWKNSGMERVVRAIRAFVAGEKYFALSHALTTRFKVALDTVLAELDKEYTALAGPVNDARAKYERLRAQAEACRAAETHELALMPAELQAIQDHAVNIMEQNRKKLEQALSDYLDTVLQKAALTANPLSMLKSTFPSVLEQVMQSTATALAAAINKPLRKAASLHLAALGKILDGTMPPHLKDNDLVLDRMEIKTERIQPSLSAEGIFSDTHGRLSEWFLGRSTRLSLLRERLLPELLAIAHDGCRSMLVSANEGIAESFALLRKDIEPEFAALLQGLAADAEGACESYTLAEADARPRVQQIEEVRQEILNVKKLLM
jgi:GTP-binding protein EngB required for normal cell division